MPKTEDAVENLKEHELVDEFVTQPLIVEYKETGHGSDIISWENEDVEGAYAVEFTAMKLALLDLGYGVEERDGMSGFNIYENFDSAPFPV